MQLPLLAGLCLLTWSGNTLQDEGGVVTVGVQERSEAVLPCSFGSKQNIKNMVFDWKKDGLEVFFYEAGIHYNNGRGGQDKQFKGRVFHFPGELSHGNASIKIQNTQEADSGRYSCTFPDQQKTYVKLVVDPDPERFVLKNRFPAEGAASEPFITTLDGTKDWVLLQCVVRGASPKPIVEWWDSAGNILPAQEPQVTQRGRSYDIILQTTVTKTDRYRCVATQEEIHHQIYTETYVPMYGAASEPSVRTLNQTKDGVLLQCVVRGASPKPEVAWKDSAGNILPTEEPQVTDRGGSYDIILQTTVTRTDYYRCVATQEEIHHEVYTETYTPVPVPEPPGFPTGWVVAAVLSAVLVGVVLAVLVDKGKLKCVEDLQQLLVSEGSVSLEDFL